MTIIITLLPPTSLLSESLFPPQKPKEIEADKDPLATETWRISTKAKDTLFFCPMTKEGTPLSGPRLENLIWRWMNVTLLQKERRKSEQAAREKPESLQTYSSEFQSPPSKIVEDANEPVTPTDSSELLSISSHTQTAEYNDDTATEPSADDTAADELSPDTDDTFTRLSSPMLWESDLNTQLAPNDPHQKSNQNNYVSSQVNHCVTRQERVVKMTKKRIAPGMACGLHRKKKKRCLCNNEHKNHNPYPIDVALKKTHALRRPGSLTTAFLEEGDRLLDTMLPYPCYSISALNPFLFKCSEMGAQNLTISSASEAVIIGTDTQTDIQSMLWPLEGLTFGISPWSHTVPYDPSIEQPSQHVLGYERFSR